MNDESVGNNSKIQGETSKNGASHNKKFKKNMDMKEVKCYCCQRFGHCAKDFYFNKESNASDKEEAQFAHAGNNVSNEVILKANIHLIQDKTNVWYFGTCCSNHMTYNKDWFIKLDKSIRMTIIIVDNGTDTYEGMWNILVKRNDGQEKS